MGRLMNIHFQLTRHQYHRLKQLGAIKWPGQNLGQDELCRRLLLDGSGKALTFAEPLLEPACQPTAGSSQ
jgi:hypothetical protein